MVNPLLQTKTRIPAPGAGDSSLVLLHGLGETADRFNALVQELHARRACNGVNIVLVQAPSRPVTFKNGEHMTRWFDVSQIGSYTLAGHTSDVDGLSETLRNVEELIDEEVALGIPRKRIVVGGFSMGGAVSIALAATLQHELGGFVCMSGFLPVWEHLASIASAANRSTPFLITHGTSDTAARFAVMEEALPVLRERFEFSRIEFVLFPGMRHKINQDCLVVIASFVERVLQ